MGDPGTFRNKRLFFLGFGSAHKRIVGAGHLARHLRFMTIYMTRLDQPAKAGCLSACRNLEEVIIDGRCRRFVQGRSGLHWNKEDGAISFPVKIVAVLTVRSGKVEALKALLFGMAKHCRAEPGNLRWDVWLDQANPDRFVLDELYRDNAAVALHRATPHFQDYFSQINELAERIAVVLDPAEVA